jgi:hypothetical protein
MILVEGLESGTFQLEQEGLTISEVATAIQDQMLLEAILLMTTDRFLREGKSARLTRWTKWLKRNVGLLVTASPAGSGGESPPPSAAPGEL